MQLNWHLDHRTSPCLARRSNRLLAERTGEFFFEICARRGFFTPPFFFDERCGGERLGEQQPHAA